MEVTEQKKALESKMAELETQTQAKLQQLEDLTQIAWKQLTQEYQSIDWNELRYQDPGEYAAKQADFARRQAEIQGAYQEVQTERQQSADKQKEKSQTTVQEETNKLLNAIPEWKDNVIAEKERGEIRSFARTLGYTDQELSNLVDHRQVLLMRDAMKYRALQSSKTTVEKRVTKAPKLAKPGSPVSKQEREANNLKSLKSTVKKSGGKKGIAEYLLATGKV